MLHNTHDDTATKANAIQKPILITNNGEHFSYSSIDNGTPDKLNKSQRFSVFEKIHGSNFQVTIFKENNHIKWSCGNRNKHLNHITDNFFCFQTAFEKYTKSIYPMFILSLSQYTSETGNTPDDSFQVVLYGEIYGGLYPNIKCPEGHKMVQARMAYCPHVDFCIFDVKIITGDNNHYWLNFTKLYPLINSTGFTPVPLLFIGTPDEINSYIDITQLVTNIPSIHNLPHIPNNWAEGVVIRPETPTHSGTRGKLIKWKHPQFDEIAFGRKSGNHHKPNTSKHHSVNDKPSNAPHPHRSDVMQLFTLSRMESVHSKTGATDFTNKTVMSEYLRLFANDIKTDAIQYFNSQNELDEFWKINSKIISKYSINIYSDFVKQQTNT